MDIVLKGDMDGIEAATEIRKRQRVPVIYLTAYTEETTLRRARVTEPFGYIVKPFSEGELRANIEMALYKHEAEGKLLKEQSDLERQVRERALLFQESEQRHRLLVEMHPYAILVLDGETIVFANLAAARLLGMQAPKNFSVAVIWITSMQTLTTPFSSGGNRLSPRVSQRRSWNRSGCASMAAW